LKLVTPLDQLRMHVVLPVVVADDPDCAVPLGDALVAGGLPLAEVTFRTRAAPDIIRMLAERGDIVVGAGTVLTQHKLIRLMSNADVIKLAAGGTARVERLCGSRR